MADSIERLYDAVLEAMDADPASSRTARLLNAGRGKIAKKVAEEAVEVAIEAMRSNRDALVRESADLLYNLAVLWASVDIEPKDVWKEMHRRERLFGIAEKLAKQRGFPKARRKLPAPAAIRLRKRG
jgi:phosphoribosyl-ATP pyrophosphohydrolase